MNLDEMLTRGVNNIIPSKDELKKALSQRKLNIYLGIDPTFTQIHLGHAVSLRKLRNFSELGHNVTFLIGDFTALVGDTSDKESERPALTKEEIEKNFKTYKEQAERIIDFSKIKVRQNSEWLSKLNLEEIIKLVQNFSANDFYTRELIRERIKKDKRVGLQEVLYPVLQGYDSYFMDTDLQVGGADQVFNMQAGRTLQRKLRNKESFVLSTGYLMGTDGRKMSKTWNNAIWLNDSPYDMFAKILSINDELILSYYNLATNVNESRIKTIEQRLTKENPLNVKKDLAFQIVSELYSTEEAEKAKEEFEKTVQGKESPKDSQTLKYEEGMTVQDILLKSGFSPSTSDVSRLVNQGGVKLNGKVVTDPRMQVARGSTLQKGKLNFVKID